MGKIALKQHTEFIYLFIPLISTNNQGRFCKRQTSRKWKFQEKDLKRDVFMHYVITFFLINLFLCPAQMNVKCLSNLQALCFHYFISQQH